MCVHPVRGAGHGWIRSPGLGPRAMCDHPSGVVFGGCRDIPADSSRGEWSMGRGVAIRRAMKLPNGEKGGRVRRHVPRTRNF